MDCTEVLEVIARREGQLEEEGVISREAKVAFGKTIVRLLIQITEEEVVFGEGS